MDVPAGAAFYAGLLGWDIVHEEPGTTVLAPPQGSVYVVFRQADGYLRPTWPRQRALGTLTAPAGA